MIDVGHGQGTRAPKKEPQPTKAKDDHNDREGAHSLSTALVRGGTSAPPLFGFGLSSKDPLARGLPPFPVSSQARDLTRGHRPRAVHQGLRSRQTRRTQHILACQE